MLDGVITTGNIVIDVLARPVDEIRWGGTEWVEEIRQSLGGNGANTSAALGMLGVPVKLIGAVGRDAFGDSALGRLDECNVDTTCVRRMDANTATTVALVKTGGTRAFLHQPGVSRLLYADPIEIETPRGFTRFHLANPFSITHLRARAADVLQQAKRLGLATSLDTAWDAMGEWMKILGPCLPDLDILFTNEDEAKMLTGESDPVRAAECFLQCGAKLVVVKRGENGCLVAFDQLREQLSAFAVNAVDTTGAGDCFVGGFLAALQRGFGVMDAAQFANAVGALNVQCLGSTSGLRGWEETLGWMKLNLKS